MEEESIDFVNLIVKNKNVNTKEEIIDIVNNTFNLTNKRAVYYTDNFAAVFCYSKNASFSNVVLSLAILKKYDNIPCFVVLVRKDLDNIIYLINTTFLDKISHSSQKLRIDNIKGSFLGSNIRKNIDELDKKNSPENFVDLFSYHANFSWEENLERLVESTNGIKPNKQKVELSEEELKNLYNSPIRAIQFCQSGNYNKLIKDLQKRCTESKDVISKVSNIDNVNIRGRLLEVLITSDSDERINLIKLIQNGSDIPNYETKNDLGDYVVTLGDTKVYVDVKTKLMSKKSCPKAYNIDKFLKCMSEEKSVFLFFFVGIDDTEDIKTVLCSVFHKKLLETTVLQQHWAGRASRGCAQFKGEIISELLNTEDLENEIDEKDAKTFLENLYAR